MSTVKGILGMRCPKCKEGKLFVNKTILPLTTCLRTVDHCPVCGQKINTGNDSAPGVNYALSVIVYALGFILYALIWGITYKDYSIYYSLAFSTLLVIVLQPWLMRLSKVIYIYLYVKFKPEG